jgi:hypothetical protein
LNIEDLWYRFARSFELIKIDRIPSFDIRFFRVSFSIKLAAFQASGAAYKKGDRACIRGSGVYGVDHPER